MPAQSITGTGMYGNGRVPYANLDNEPELTAEQVKAAYEAALLADQDHQDRLASQQAADAFTAGHPEFVDNQANALLMVNQVETMFGKGLHTLDQWETAYAYLRENTNFLKLDAKELAKQQKAAARRRFDTERAHIETRRFDEGADYSNLSLDEIKRRADEAIRQDMQRAGERGGNGF